MEKWPKSQALLERNEKWIPGGVVSLNRKCNPNISFSKGTGSHVWDIEGNEYIDYQAGFSAVFLGHNDPDVNLAVKRAMDDSKILMGAGPTDYEGEFAELFCKCVPNVEKIQITNTGSEATFHALRIARSATNKDHIIIIQGGYNGWHNDVAGNVISSFSSIHERVSPGEYPFDAISSGIPSLISSFVHVVNYNDLESITYVAERYPIACVILEPILQNIGVVKPMSDYLKGLRILADQFGFLLIFDEVKTGFRHALGGYQSICGVNPDLSTFGKAVGNGFPMGVIGGKSEYMDYFIHPEKSKRVLIAGTYNAHPISTAAAIATLKKLSSKEYNVYDHIEEMGSLLDDGIQNLLSKYNLPFQIGRQGSAFCLYFMDHLPVDYHDILENNNFDRDKLFRFELIKQGIFVFPISLKQSSIGYAHSKEDINKTLNVMDNVFSKIID